MAVSRTDESIYFVPLSTDGDIWLATLTAPGK